MISTAEHLAKYKTHHLSYSSLMREELWALLPAPRGQLEVILKDTLRWA